jgi:uncharacterized protein YecE (DUF72 family)
MDRKQGGLRIGTSGYHYEHWQGVFYPKEIPKDRWFAHYARHFDTVEINNTFYHLPQEATFDSWYDQAPAGFCYALKFSRYGSHLKRLKAPQESIDTFIHRAERLKSYLGPILVQLPPRWKVNAQRLAAFLEAAPKRDRWAVEFRDPSWLCDEIYAILAEHRAALCIHDMIDNHPRRMTADWTYLRFHGDHYRGSYSHQFLTAEARCIREYLADGLDVFAYFNNDQQGYAVQNAADLRRYVHPD